MIFKSRTLLTFWLINIYDIWPVVNAAAAFFFFAASPSPMNHFTSISCVFFFGDDGNERRLNRTRPATGHPIIRTGMQVDEICPAFCLLLAVSF